MAGFTADNCRADNNAGQRRTTKEFSASTMCAQPKIDQTVAILTQYFLLSFFYFFKSDSEIIELDETLNQVKLN